MFQINHTIPCGLFTSYLLSSWQTCPYGPEKNQRMNHSKYLSPLHPPSLYILVQLVKACERPFEHLQKAVPDATCIPSCGECRQTYIHKCKILLNVFYSNMKPIDCGQTTTKNRQAVTEGLHQTHFFGNRTFEWPRSRTWCPIKELHLRMSNLDRNWVNIVAYHITLHTEAEQITPSLPTHCGWLINFFTFSLVILYPS